jgi:hypothetical protein
MTCSPNDKCRTHTAEAATITKDAALVLMGLTQWHSEASCAKLVSQSIFECQATSSSMTAKLTLVSSWRNTTSCAEWVEQMMTSSSSSFSQSTRLIPQGPGWIIYQETSPIARRISERSSLATSRAPMCALVTPGA